MPGRRACRGFTLLEVMVALAIAATALVVLMGRLGGSADIQRDLSLHARAVSTAVDQLERIAAGDQAVPEASGEMQTDAGTFAWKTTQTATLDAHFVRQDITVTDPDGGTVSLFLYRSLP